MPWKIVDGKERYERPRPDPFTLPPGIEEDTAEAKAWHWEHRHEFGPWSKRLIVDFVEMHKYCPRKACRRAKACRSPTFACHDEAKPVLDEAFYPQFRELIHSRQPTGDDRSSDAGPSGGGRRSRSWRNRDSSAASRR